MRATSTTVARLNHVSKYYANLPALQEVSLDIRAGEVLALLGPNGAGKTTAISLLLGLMRPTKGEVRLFDEDPKSLRSRSRLGVMLQLSGVPETLKVREHITLYSSYYPRALSLQETLEASGLVGLEDKLYGKLSGGQKQRLHLALAICGNPDLLFLDEPTTGLDVASRRALWEQVRRFTGKGRTVVLTTHYLEEADALSDRIVVINKGRMIAEGSPAEIKAKTVSQKIRVMTSLSPALIAGLPGVTSVRQEGAAVEVFTSKAEPVVLSLLQQDKTLSGLEVSSTGLEDAFLDLTQASTSMQTTL